jgi:hypothetical protein
MVIIFLLAFLMLALLFIPTLLVLMKLALILPKHHIIQTVSVFPNLIN